MKVKALLEVLLKSDPEATVIVACDSEGNKYSPLGRVDTDKKYWADSPLEGDVGTEKEFNEWQEGAIPDGSDPPVDAAVLYPMV